MTYPGVILVAVQALHGDIAQSNRERVLKRFRDGKLLVLVATDVAARGLDIPAVDLVVHYELPTVSGFHIRALYVLFWEGSILCICLKGLKGV